jgi:phosphohistidine phosphatase SixA
MPYHQVCHAHCPKGSGGAGAVLVLLAVIVAVIASSAHRIEHAADVVLEVLTIAVASLAALAVVAAGAYVALRVHRSHARTRQALVSHTPAIQRGSQALSAPQRQAIEAPKRGLYVIHDEQHDHDRL